MSKVRSLMRWAGNIFLGVTTLIASLQPCHAFEADSGTVMEQVIQAGQFFNNEIAFSEVISDVDALSQDDLSLAFLNAFTPGLTNQQAIDKSVPTYAEILKPEGLYVGGITNGTVIQLFRLFTVGLFVLTLAMQSYGSIAMVLDSSLDGNPLGRNVGNRYFLLFRSAATLSAFLPLPATFSNAYQSGFSLAQALVYQIAVFGVYFANGLWYLIVAAMVAANGGVSKMMLDANPQQQFSVSSKAAMVQDSVYRSQLRLVNELNEAIEKANTPKALHDSLPVSILASLMCMRAHLGEDIKDPKHLRVQASAQSERGFIDFQSAMQQQYTPSQSDSTTSLTQGSDEGGSEAASQPNCGRFVVTYPKVSAHKQDSVKLMVDSGLNNLVLQMNTIANQIPPGTISTSACQAEDGQVPVLYSGCYNALSELSGVNGYLRRTGRWRSMQNDFSKAVEQYFRFQMLMQVVINKAKVSVQSAQSPIEQLLKGGWAMASNNYMYFSKRMQKIKQPQIQYADLKMDEVSFEGAGFCQNSAKNRFICQMLLEPLAKNYALKANVTPLPLPKSGLETSTQAQESSNDCNENPKACENITTTGIGSRSESGAFTLGVSMKGLLSDFEHIDLSKPAQPFTKIGNLKGICNVPFAGSHCNTQQGIGGTVTSSQTSAIKLLGAYSSMFLIPVITTFTIAVPKIITYPIVAAGFGAAGVVFNQFFDQESQSPYNFFKPSPWTGDLNALYPKSLQDTAYSFTYYVSEAWYNTFINDRTEFFLHPLDAMSKFGFKMLRFGIAFMSRVGIESFISNYNVALNIFLQRANWEVIQTVSLRTAQRVAELGVWMRKLSRPNAVQKIAMTPQDMKKFAAWSKYVGRPFFGSVVMDMIEGVNYAEFATSIVRQALVFIGYPLTLIPITAPVGSAMISTSKSLGAIAKIVSNVQKGLGAGMEYGGRIAIGVINGYIATQLARYSDIFLGIVFSVNEQWTGLYFAICVPLMVLGSLFAYFLPIFPNILYSFGVLSWLLFYLEAVLATPLILLGMSNPKGHPLLGNAQKLMMMLLAVALKPALILLGFLLSNASVSMAVMLFYAVAFPALETMLSSWVSGSDWQIFSIVLILAMVIYLYMIFQIIVYSFSLTYHVPTRIFRWIGLQPEPAEEADVARQISEQFKQTASETIGGGQSTTQGMSSKAKEMLGSLR